MNLQLAPLAADVPWPPSVDEFFPPGIGGSVWVTKFSIMIWIAVAVIIAFFLVTQRNPKVVPTKAQWFGESIYGFVRNGIIKEVIGQEGIRFAPYLTTLFVFIAFVNLFAIIPGFQISPSSHIAFPAVLAFISFVIYWYEGSKKHRKNRGFRGGVGGFFRYIWSSIYLPAPLPVQFILLPIELAQILLIRPVTLAVRLFANLFAGHLILLVFTLGGFVLLGTGNIGLAAVGVVSWGMAIVMTLFEAGVALLQAYVFVLLSASYIQSSLSDEH